MFKSLLLASTLALGVSAKGSKIVDEINQLASTLNSSAPAFTWNTSIPESCHDQCKGAVGLTEECQTKQNSHCTDVMCGDAGSHYKPCLMCVNRTEIYDAFTQECAKMGKHIGDESIKVSSATSASGSILAAGAVAVGGALVALF